MGKVVKVRPGRGLKGLPPGPAKKVSGGNVTYSKAGAAPVVLTTTQVVIDDQFDLTTNAYAVVYLGE